MARVPITVLGYRCERCNYEWIPRDREPSRDPTTCPNCKSPYWNQPRKSTMSYEEFRDTIREELKAANDGLTWTELRTASGLPQMFPNNQWVRRLEADIGLQRTREKQGIIRWRMQAKGKKA